MTIPIHQALRKEDRGEEEKIRRLVVGKINSARNLGDASDRVGGKR